MQLPINKNIITTVVGAILGVFLIWVIFGTLLAAPEPTTSGIDAKIDQILPNGDKFDASNITKHKASSSSYPNVVVDKNSVGVLDYSTLIQPRKSQ